MTIPLPPGQTPYITAPMLLSGAWPVGVDFSTLPPGRLQQDASVFPAVTNLAAEATTECEAFCNQPLRADLATETFHGPGDGANRVTVQNGSGLGRIILQRFAVMTVLSVMVSPNTWPRQWIPVPDGSYGPEYAPIGPYGSQAPTAAGQGGQAILIQQGYLTWALGRNGYVIQVQYLHGWPHTALTADATADTDTITVDDCTGWAPVSGSSYGAAGVVYDGASQEAMNVSASTVTAGPGTMTLTADLASSHQAGTLVSSLPQDVIWGAALFAGAAALTRGAASTSVRDTPGRGSGGDGGAEGLRKAAMGKLVNYRRTI